MGDWSYAQEVPSSGWRGVMSLPRRLGLVETAEGARLTQRPVAAVDDLLVPLVTFGPGTVVGTRIGADRAAALGVLHLECFDLVVDLEVGPRSQGCLEIRAATHADEHVSVTYDTEHRTLSLDRSRAGPAPFHRTHGGRAVVGLEPEDGIVRLRVVGDTCTTEVFGNDGRAAMSALTYPSRPGCGIHLAASRGPLKYRSVELRGRPVHRVL
jgi:sucrose-6-phosphate hydrolase SacC (GH32 family)